MSDGTSKEMQALARWVQERCQPVVVGPEDDREVHNHIHTGSAAEIVTTWVRNAIAANQNKMFEEFVAIEERSQISRLQILSVIRHYGGDKLAETYIQWKGL